ncbi:MAG: hypothetical protein O8C63_03055 [Candidatus Methanoperedens sp.]|nr:hypothetical protein [Candidatus Methanoperedens sp.]
MFDDKAQMHTLEGVAAATIMLLVIVYAIDATSMTPLTSSTANVHVETELQVIGQDMLGALDYAEPGYNSKLKNDVLTWNGKEYTWNGTKYMEKGNASYLQNNLTNNLTNLLNATLITQGIAHNVELTFLANNGTTYVTQRMIYNGNPSENAVIVSRKIALHNDDINKTKLPNNPINDIDSSTDLYNIVDVKLILWRM